MLQLFGMDMDTSKPGGDTFVGTVGGKKIEDGDSGQGEKPWLLCVK